jgi:lipopolysaccharide transport system ATP-binding protein
MISEPKEPGLTQLTGETVVRVERLSKVYRIGATQLRHNTLRDALVSTLKRTGKGGNSGTLRALDNVSFEVRRGEVVGLIGRNGAGKSTLLKVLSRITEPTEGRAEIRGRVASLLEVGTGFHPELTGRENIYLNGAILGMRRTEIAAKFDEIVEFAEIERFLDTPVKRYSSGMYVRLAFAVAAHLEPEILLVDEVLAVGDAAFQDRCLGKMGDVARSGRTVLFVSHNLGAIKRLCPRSIWVDSGRIARIGTSGDIIGAYLDSAGSHGGSWQPNDESHDAQARSVTVCAMNMVTKAGSRASRFQMDESFSIEVTYSVLSSLENLRVGFTITADDGTVVFESKDTDPADYGRSYAAGNYTARCHVPGNLLNAGRYYVTLIVDRPHQELLFRRDQALSFAIQATDGAGLRAGDTRLGLVRPILEWSCEDTLEEARQQNADS